MRLDQAAMLCCWRRSATCVFIDFLELLEGTHLDLANPLAADVILLGQILERRRAFLQAALDQDVPLTIIQRAATHSRAMPVARLAPRDPQS